MKKTTLFLGLACALSLTACTDNGLLFRSNGKDYITTDTNGVYKIGDPYQVGSIWYRPQENDNYKEVGIASWYGPEFHKGVTANGETYNMHMMTAAHRTLPLPSVVKVTNLDNGLSVLVRVNDRGPFVNNRIIDLSKAAAEKLDFIDSGTAKVKVEIMKDESKALKAKILANGGKVVGGAPIVEMQEKQDDKEPLVLVPSANSTVAAVEEAPIFEPQKVKMTTPVTRGFFVQLGAFKDYDNAMAVQSRFTKAGSTVIVPLEKNGTTLYRVRIGPYQEANQAVGAMDTVEKMGYSDMRLIEEK